MELLEIRTAGNRVAMKYEDTDNRWIVCRHSDGFGPGIEWKFEHELKDWLVVYTRDDKD